MATPEAPIHDFVHAAWQFVPLASDEACRWQGWTRLTVAGGFACCSTPTDCPLKNALVWASAWRPSRSGTAKRGACGCAAGSRLARGRVSTEAYLMAIP